MPSLSRRNPTYRRHRASGQAVVTIGGRDVYLGPHGTKVSRNEYDRVVGEWLAAGRRSPTVGTDITVAEVAARFWTHAQAYYRGPTGAQTSEVGSMQNALKPLIRLYGKTPARDFGPLALEAVRGEMLRMGWCRSQLNKQVARLKMLFKWAVAKELLPASVHHALVTVSGLRAGRSEARESEPVRPVAAATIEKTLLHLSSTIAAMVQLQRFTGARPGEICGLRTCDIDRSEEVWTIKPATHKTAHHGHTRTIHVGQRGQAVLMPFLNLAAPEAFCFSPAAAEAERLERLHTKRKTPLSCGNRPGTNRRRRPKHWPGDVYDVDAYRRAITRGCDVAFPPPAPLVKKDSETISAWRARLTPLERKALATWQHKHRWHPHQLRHTAATEIRKRFGIEAAQHVLGHSGLAVTQLYAEKNSETAKAVAAAIG
jgi:integrase